MDHAKKPKPISGIKCSLVDYLSIANTRLRFGDKPFCHKHEIINSIYWSCWSKQSLFQLLKNILTLFMHLVTLMFCISVNC